MRTYQEFLDRIDSFEKKEVFYGYNYFHGNPSIAQKVNQENQFQPFYGDTMVFRLPDKMFNEVKYLNYPLTSHITLNLFFGTLSA